jgi:hypothetical protein
MQHTVIGVKVNLKVLNFQQRVGGHPEISLKHAARIIGIPQAIANVIDGEHSDENQGTRKQGPVDRYIHVIFGIEQNATPSGNVWRKA